MLLILTAFLSSCETLKELTDTNSSDRVILVTTREITSYTVERVADYPFDSRDGSAGVFYQGAEIITGGWNPAWASITTNDVYINNVKHIGPFKKRHSHASLVYNGELHMFLGDGIPWYQNDHWVYDGLNWVELSPPPFKDRMLSIYASTTKGMFVYFGQQVQSSLPAGSTAYYNESYRYSGNGWEPLGVAGVSPRGIIIGNSSYKDLIVIAGGGLYPTNVNNREFYNDVFLSLDGVNFTLQPSPPWVPRQYHNVCEYKGYFFVAFGGTFGGVPLADMWYTSDFVTWYELDLPAEVIPRHAAMLYTDGDYLYFGTGSASVPMKDKWRIKING